MNKACPDNLTLVAEFMHHFEQPVSCGFDEPHVLRLGMKLINEECHELEEATDLIIKDHYTTGGDHEQLRAHFIKELSDLLFVCYWMAAAVGVDIDEAFYRVWQSNMSKLGKDGRPVKREDGKVLKGPEYFLPVLKDLVRKTPITL